MLKIRNQQTGAIETLSGDVRHSHSGWVHHQCGTDSEAELQGLLDQLYWMDFAEKPDTEDICGIFMGVEDAADYIAECRADPNWEEYFAQRL